MTRIEFHVVESGAADARLQYASDWLQALGSHTRAHVFVECGHTRAHFQPLLESHPHVSLISSDAPLPRPDKQTVIVNLAACVPPVFSRYRCALDIADKRGHSVEADRERYRFYRDRGYPITLHTIDAQEVA